MDLEEVLHKLEEAIDSIREHIDNPFNEYDEEEW